MKRIFYLVLSMLLVLSLVGCGETPSSRVDRNKEVGVLNAQGSSSCPSSWDCPNKGECENAPQCPNGGECCGGNHSFVDGVCSLCGRICENNGVCDGSGKGQGNGSCDGSQKGQGHWGGKGNGQGKSHCRN